MHKSTSRWMLLAPCVSVVALVVGPLPARALEDCTAKVEVEHFERTDERDWAVELEVRVADCKGSYGDFRLDVEIKGNDGRDASLTTTKSWQFDGEDHKRLRIDLRLEPEQSISAVSIPPKEIHCGCFERAEGDGVDLEADE